MMKRSEEFKQEAVRQLDKLEYRAELNSEALALFVRFWLTANPPLPDAARASAQAQGKERFEGFVEALARKWILDQSWRTPCCGLRLICRTDLSYTLASLMLKRKTGLAGAPMALTSCHDKDHWGC
ncbi:hypothetical protein [Novosphingobium aquae]|uniref:Uncharacterized protein n=1 Tax=Novosphingobium aquae TaxID=3133435 RepID=A0ABU8S9Y4_9SPHN